MDPTELKIGEMYEILDGFFKENPVPTFLKGSLLIYFGKIEATIEDLIRYKTKKTKYLFLISRRQVFPLNEKGSYLFGHELEWLRKIE